MWGLFVKLDKIIFLCLFLCVLYLARKEMWKVLRKWMLIGMVSINIGLFAYWYVQGDVEEMVFSVCIALICAIGLYAQGQIEG